MVGFFLWVAAASIRIALTVDLVGDAGLATAASNGENVVTFPDILLGLIDKHHVGTDSIFTLLLHLFCAAIVAAQLRKCRHGYSVVALDRLEQVRSLIAAFTHKIMRPLTIRLDHIGRTTDKILRGDDWHGRNEVLRCWDILLLQVTIIRAHEVGALDNRMQLLV